MIISRRWFLFCSGVYTRISVYRDWINETISRNSMGSDPQLFNMANNIDMNNDLEIWWDRDVESKGEDDFIMRKYLLVFCLFIVIVLNIKYE
jgi:hypothetical protein